MSKENSVQVIEQQQPAGLITPAGSVEETVNQFRLYQELKQKIGQDEDFQKIGEKRHPKKSFVRKVQRFFNLSCEIVQDEPLKEDGKIIAWLAKARAVHLGTGAYQEADGACSFDEKVDRQGKPVKKQQTIHNIRAHAITRAKNRAILDLVGFGEVSAEEINHQEYQHQQQRPQQQSKQDPLVLKKKEALQIGRNKGLTDEQIVQLLNVIIDPGDREPTVAEMDELIGHIKSNTKEELLELIAPPSEEDEAEAKEVEVLDVSDPKEDEVAEVLGLNE
ncbi:hypothetical protein [Mechercharimyces sp. CAU 1602]|uniref:hypothetical protein n=1 Tax=Mechercharimyces sp. CAU 1602 TaxID=2973933 RepID=UPI0021629ED4|nr:hypothetical protein [Mechercharimyces sp. CAU 1602]MCS1351182.1 hypothetical protein [Mechercharimyces sp. CAU 1602]